eukprot:GILJ01000197.1.p2 GENE.GILJ01000197.1~~GILJ01000197.1.p2  ORF type:complete len:118 (-),score=12.79 GILJ01000197.1:1-354(-)
MPQDNDFSPSKAILSPSDDTDDGEDKDDGEETTSVLQDLGEISLLSESLSVEKARFRDMGAGDRSCSIFRHREESFLRSASSARLTLRSSYSWDVDVMVCVTSKLKQQRRQPPCTLR